MIDDDGNTAEDWVKIFPIELPVDGVSFASIVTTYKYDFDLTVNELIYYVRLAIYELYEQGARPVTFSSLPYYWEVLPQYGNTKEEIADNIIKEWQKNNYNDPDLGSSPWFHLLNESCYIPNGYK